MGWGGYLVVVLCSSRVESGSGLVSSSAAPRATDARWRRARSHRRRERRLAPFGSAGANVAHLSVWWFSGHTAGRAGLRGAVRWSARKDAGGARGGDLPQAEVAIPRCLGRDDARAQQHRPDRVHPHRGRVQDQHTLNTSVGHDQLADRHAQTLDEEQDVLVHLRVAGSGSDGVDDEAAG